MKTWSITRRIVVVVLLCELLLIGAMSVTAVLYERHQQLQIFEVMLRGRADSVFGAVGDAGDKEDTLALDTYALDLPKDDVYEVRQDHGPLLGRTNNWQGVPDNLDITKEGGFSLRVSNHRYRGIVLHGVRSVDSSGEGDGIQYGVTVFYAAPTKPIERAFRQSIKFFGLIDLLLLTATGIILVLLLRRAAQPLRTLASRAALVNAQSLTFSAPEEAYRVEELAPLASALDTAMRGIERAFTQQRDFLSDAAHELKTAVTLVKSSLQLLGSRERTVREYADGLELCLSDCARMEELVMKMLTLARLERLTSVGIRPARTVIKECVADVVTQIEALARLREVSIETAAPQGLAVQLSPDDAESLIKNLVLNAVQHSKSRGNVRVKAYEEEDGNVHITIADEGEGIAAEHLPRIFDRFYRGDASRSRNTGGTGLGLAICKAIVEAYHGSIHVASRVAEGTTVTIHLPKAISLVPEKEQVTIS